MSASRTTSASAPPRQAPNPGLPRWIDAVLAAAALVVLTPLLLLLGGLVALTSRGPMLFRQQRIGQDGRAFTFYKFRSMVVVDPASGDSGPALTASGDPRVTAIGKVLRKLKLDELPELWNVLKGDMALVGPRPEVPRYVDMEDPLWRDVLAARPGLTDPVTLRLRNEEEMLGALEGDTDAFYRSTLLPFKLRGYRNYLWRRSMWSDLQVLWDTFLGILIPGRNPPPTTDEVERLWGQAETAPSGAIPMGSWFQRHLRQLQYLLDLAVLAGAFLIAYLLRFDFSPPAHEWDNLLRQLPYVLVLQLALYLLLGIHQFVWRYISLTDVQAFARAGLICTIILLTSWWLLPDSLQDWRVPRSVIVLDALLAFGGLLALRVGRRMQYERSERERRTVLRGDQQARPTAVLLVGAGRAGALAAQEIQGRPDRLLSIKGFLDDDPAKQGTMIRGTRVLGTIGELPQIGAALGIDHVIVTIADASPLTLQRILNLCQKIPAPMRIMPGLYQILDGDVQVRRSQAE